MGGGHRQVFAAFVMSGKFYVEREREREGGRRKKGRRIRE
jgi:hypothetical protein